MAKQNMVSFDTFAFKLGQATRLTRDASLPLAAAYASGTPEQQANLRERWVREHLRGQGYAKPETVMAQSRTERSAEDQRAYAMARAHLNYHIVRREDAAPSNKRVQEPVRARVVRPLAATMIASVIDAGLTKAELAALIDAIKAGVSFE